MNTENVLSSKKALREKLLCLAICISSAVTLPQLFHLIGTVSGTGAALGSAFLPMHIPVFAAGLMAGPAVGILAGAISPVLSFAISGMPAAALLPFMMIELAGYGLFSGLLANTKTPVFFKLLFAQICGRAARSIALVFAVYAIHSTSVPISSIWETIVDGLPGILLQWALIPLLIFRLNAVFGKKGSN